MLLQRSSLVFAGVMSLGFHTGCGGAATPPAHQAESRGSEERAPTASYSTGTVRSADGTVIGYRRIGQGPALIIVEGAVSTTYNYDQLARALARDFTVYVADRRGRGMSPCRFSDEAAAIARDVEDVDALLQRSGAHVIFGLSSGAIVALESTRALPAIHRTVLYEPPFYPRRDVPRALIARFHEQVAGGQLPAALVTAGEIVKLGPQFPPSAPHGLKTLATRSVMFVDDVRGSGEYTSLRDLLPAMRFDFRVVESRGDELDSFKVVKTPVLLLGGTRSPAYLGEALDALATTLPNVQREVLTGLDHSGPWNLDIGGDPDVVAAHVRIFLSAEGGAGSPPDVPSAPSEPLGEATPTQPAWYWLGGFTAGATTVAHDRGGYLGGEMSVLRTANGLPHVGPYADAYHDLGAHRTYTTGGAELGYRFVGVDLGGAARLGGSRAEGGAAARLFVTLGLVSVYARYAYFVDALGHDDEHVVQLGALVRLPFAQGGD